MRITVRTFDGKQIGLEEVQSEDTIQSIKRKIQTQEGIRIDLQRLLFENKSLDNDRTLSYYNIVDDSILYIVLRSVENSKTVAGGYGLGSTSRELCFPYGLVFDEDQTMIIADWGNHRIVVWKIRDTNGQVIAGGNGQGNELNQLNCPTDLLIDKQTNSLIICDRGNRRVVRWSRVDGTTEGEILLDDITCWGLAMDNQRCLYISDIEKNEVIRYHMEDNNRTVVAGGHGRGFGLNQLNGPTYIFVDQHQTLYVSDTWNHRVMKWDKDATEGSIIVRGFPRGLFVDVKGDVYVADYGSHQLICWPKGETKGTVIAGGNAGGEEANQLYYPWGLSSDRQGNLYVADHSSHRIQRFPVKQAN